MNWLDIIVAVVIWRVLDALFPETFLDRWGRALAAKVGQRLGTRPTQHDGPREGG
jgi:hypothetical protein